VARSARRPRVRIREIRTASDPAVVRAHRLLRRIFPRAELSPRREWTRTLREGEHGLWTDMAWHLLVAERGGTVLGVASGTYLGNVNVGVVGYVAVTSAARSLGLGPRLRRRLRERFERDARRVREGALGAIVGEVHADNRWLKTLVRRHGAIALDFPFEQPAIAGTLKPVPLVLYYEPLDRPRRSLEAAELRRLLFSLYRRAYRISRPLQRPPFRRMLKSLAGRRRIGQRRLD
jgi:GNAT superfamily N-acetyltransferase